VTPTTQDAVLGQEQGQLDLAFRCMAAMRTDADKLVDAGIDELAAAGLARLRAQRLASLAADPGTPPFFGRIDRDGSRDGHRDGAETFHLGRRHIRDGNGDPVVIDWRVPVARAFYQATASDRMDLRLRRRFGFHDGTLTSYEDEHLDQGENLGLASDLLREEIERPRVGPMRDIVATIQPDQDDLVRAPFEQSLCIQGAPGTGKTAVGLHRAAYLLYTYAARLRRSGVLVVGPNAAFLHYTAEVLPTLGEVGVAQATVTELLHAGRRTVTEDDDRATLKGDARMAGVLRRAVQSAIRRPDDDLMVPTRSVRYRVPASRLRRYVDDIRRSGVRWTVARERLHHQIASDARRQQEDGGGAPTDAETARVARSPVVKAFVNDVWPSLTAEGVLLRLFTDADHLRACAHGDLTEDELVLLAWPTLPRSPRSAPWTAADLVLLDELAAAIDGVPGFDHIVVDEAQDLSAMQCRAIGRRCPLGSVTVLGDLAQATTPWAPGSWSATLEHLGHPAAEVRPLTAGYRVPQPILDLANRLLPHIATDVPPATSVRSGQHALAFAPLPDLPDVVRRALAVEGSVGVIVPDAMADEVLASLRSAGIGGQPLDADADERVRVVPAGEAKGLEYDTVVLVEPARIVAAESRRAVGLRRLYVTLTRAVSHLTVVHDEPLPPELA
jgi:DNA helicase IV